MASTTINVGIIPQFNNSSILEELSQTSNNTFEKSSTTQSNVELNEDTINNIIANYLENNV